jgi:hypothetical protein
MWYIPEISVLKRLRQENCKVKASQGYTARLWLKKKKI